MVKKIIRGNFPASEEIINVPTVAALKALDTDGLERAFLGGYFADGDGGGGKEFRFNSLSTDADNGGTIHIPTFVGFGGVGRWEMLDVNMLTPKHFGATGDGVANDTAEVTAIRTVTNGKYHISEGTYLVDASPDIFLDTFTADANTFIKIGATTRNISNAFAGRLRYNATSDVLTFIVDAVTGNNIIGIQNAEPGTATTFFGTVAIITDSHFIQAQPATDGGETDLLFQRSTANADPAGNRFNITFEEVNDRLLFSTATTTSGFPSFDSFMEVLGGDSGNPSLNFPAFQANFKQGWSVQDRAATGFLLEMLPVSSTTVRFKDTVSGNFLMSFGSDALGFYASSPVVKPIITGSRGGNAALASLLTALNLQGLITNSTTA